MNKHNSLNLKLSNSQLSKLKSAMKNETEVILRLSSNIKQSRGFPDRLVG